MHHVGLVPVVGQPVPFCADLARGIELRPERLQVEVDEEQTPFDQRQVVAIRRALHEQLPTVRPVVPPLRR